MACRAAEKTRVLILSGYRPLHSALREVLEGEGIDVVGESSTMSEGVRLARTVAPEVMILDERLPDGDAQAVCRQLSESGTPTRCIVLTSWASCRTRRPSPGNPIFLLRQIAGTDLPRAVRTAARQPGSLRAS